MLVEKTLKRQALFWEKVNKLSGSDACWLWTGAKNENGYGWITVYENSKQRFYFVHKVSFEWEYGEISEGSIIRHKCDTPLCVRPSHLVVGTQQQNVQDMIDRGRHVGNRDIDEATVVKIRLLKAGGLTTEQLCEQFDLSSQHINAICRGVYWPNAGGPITRRFEITDELIWTIQAGYRDAEGETFMDKCRSLADVHGISVASVQNIVRYLKKSKFPLSFYTF